MSKFRLFFIEPLKADAFSAGFLLFLLTLLSAVPHSTAVTIRFLYTDVPGVGFNDPTELTQEDKDLLARSGNSAITLGEAKRNALEHAASLLEDKLPGANVIRVETFFKSFEDETVVATTRMRRILNYGPRELHHIGYPPALAEKIAQRELLDESIPHFIMEFSRSSDFYYGFTDEAPSFSVDFVTLAIHEIIHGLGFHSSLQEDGSFPQVTLDVEDGTRIDIEQWQRIYDVQMYSEADSEFVVNLEPSGRMRAATSETGLLWDGTVRPSPRRESSCSYGQRMAELKSAGIDSDGRPQLHAPSSFDRGSSITHVHTDTDDIMEYLYPFPRDMDLSFGMLRDMGWEISDDGFPPSCVPTGVTVTPTSGLVTTEDGGTATFSVKLESEPISSVVIPLRSSDPDEGVADTQALEFTPANWAMAQTVTVSGINDDGEEDGPKRYVISLERAESRDRFYNGFNPADVLVTNRDNDPEPDTTLPDSMPPPERETGQGGSGCAIAAEEQVRYTSRSGMLARFLPAALLVFAILCRSLRREKPCLTRADFLSD
ncbi:MAG: hypothetical protein F4154_04305 [Candidatus Dadabacteria bacterium]|nr:hypothetical protein [Candidatus Dadabacteria bacterium]